MGRNTAFSSSTKKDQFSFTRNQITNGLDDNTIDMMCNELTNQPSSSNNDATLTIVIDGSPYTISTNRFAQLSHEQVIRDSLRQIPAELVNPANSSEKLTPAIDGYNQHKPPSDSHLKQINPAQDDVNFIYCTLNKKIR